MIEIKKIGLYFTAICCIPICTLLLLNFFFFQQFAAKEQDNRMNITDLQSIAMFISKSQS